MKIEEWEIDSVKPYETNPRNNENAVAAVANSIATFGFRQPIVVDRNGEIIIGHTRWKEAKKLGLKTVPVHVAEDLTDEQKAAYRIIDNKTAELATWDYPLLVAEIEKIPGVDLSDFGFDPDWLDRVIDRVGDGEESEPKYVELVKGIFYEPRMEKPPPIDSLYDASYANEMIARIEKANIDEKLKEFLRLSAIRHVRFRFDLIAEFYCHASDEVKQLFRDLALVIVDLDQQLEKQWVLLSERLVELIQSAENDEPESE